LAKGAGSAEAATFALFGLLVAFTFSGAASRFMERRDLVQDETNAIGTAYLRLDLLPSDVQPAIRDLFRKYVDTRYEAYRRAYDTAFTQAKLAETSALQTTIWNSASAAVQRPGTPASTPNPSRSWLHTLTFAAVISLTVYVIIDIEFPRFGLIRVDAADAVLLELRETMQ
jgi:hypothetical protein